MSYKTAAPDRYELLKACAREKRKKAALAETMLWEHIRGKALGVKFLRQHVIGDYIADFLSCEGGLVIEVDGGYHAERQQHEDDLYREKVLESMGYHVIRFTNEEVVEDIDRVLTEIKHYFDYGE